MFRIIEWKKADSSKNTVKKRKKSIVARSTYNSWALFLIAFFITLTLLLLYANFDPKEIEKKYISFKPSIGTYIASEYAINQNKIDKAADLYSNALTHDKENELFIKKGLESFLASGKVEDAIELAHHAYNKEIKSSTVLLLLAVESVKKEKHNLAEKYFNELLEIPENNEINLDKRLTPYFLLWVYVGQGKYEVATQKLDVIYNTEVVPSLFINYQSALIYDLADQKEKAKEQYKLSLKLPPAPYHFVRAVGNFYQRIGQHEKAEEVYRKFSGDNPNENFFQKNLKEIKNKKIPERIIRNEIDGIAEVMTEATRVLYRTNIIDEALKYIHLSLYLKENQEETKIYLGSFYETTKQYKKAIKLYESFNENSDFYWQVQVRVAENLYNLEKIVGAKRLFLKIIKENPDDVSPLIHYADILRRDMKYEEAIEIYQKIIEHLGEAKPSHWNIYFALGICYERIDEWDKAEEALQKSLKLKPQQAEVLNYLGYSWIDRNENLEQALDMVGMALVQKPNDPQITDSMAWGLFRLGKYDKAAEYMEKAIEDLPYDPILNDHLGDIYWMQGRKLEAKFQWQRSLQYANDEINKQVILNKIESGLE